MITLLLLVIDYVQEFASKYGYGIFIPIILTAVFVALIATAGVRHIIIPGVKQLLGIRRKLIGFDAVRNNIPMLIEEFEGLK